MSYLPQFIADAPSPSPALQFARVPLTNPAYIQFAERPLPNESVRRLLDDANRRYGYNS